MKTLIKILTLTLSTFLLNSQTTKAQCHIDDWTALKALYESTDGDNWLIRTGWDVLIDNQNSPPANCNLGNLYGISLNGLRVACIDLDGLDDCSHTRNLFGNYLNGNLPNEIGNLSFLNEIHLSNNFIQGIIPAEIGNFSFLEELTLENNKLSGNIPVEIGNLLFLENLYLGDNKLTGSIPEELGNLMFVENIQLYGNKLSGTLPPQLGNLTNLQSFGINPNQIGGILPVELSNLVNLRSLYLAYNNFNGPIPSWLGDLANMEDLRLDNNQFTGNLPPELCNLNNLTRLEINNNNLSGSYPGCYDVFCTQLYSSHFDCNIDISDGNNFDISWEEFCCCKGGKCDSCSPQTCSHETSVYPGDLNNDGVVNGQDISLSGFFLYNSGPARALEHQNTDWYPHPSEYWGIVNNQNIDIMHHDCNGDGEINENDQQVVLANMGETWKPFDTIPPPEESDYQVMLHPIDQVYDGYLVMNVALEKRSGGNLALQGGHFTIDYSNLEADFSNVVLTFLPISWLGTFNDNLLYETNHLSEVKKIEVGFTKTNNTNSEGNGVIAQLILVYDNSAAILSGASTVSYQFEVSTIGVHQSNGSFIPIENQQLNIEINSNTCYSNLIIDEDAPFQNLYQSSNNITTNGFVLIGEKQEVEYNANRVRINTGFSVKAGAEFKVRNSGCD